MNLQTPLPGDDVSPYARPLRRFAQKVTPPPFVLEGAGSALALAAANL